MTKNYLISFPKCGRTWLKTALGYILCKQHNLSPQFSYNNEYINQLLLLTHEYNPDVINYQSFKNFSEDKSFYKNSRITLLIRDPRDVVVSFYFEQLKRQKILDKPEYKDVTLKTFIRSDNFGIKKIVQFYNLWYGKENEPIDFQIIKYEDMVVDLKAELKKLCQFLNLQVPEKYIQESVNFTRFENLQKLESKNYFKTPRLTPKNIQDKNSYKVREGKIGSYKNYLDEEDIEFLNKELLKLKYKFYK